MQFTFSSFGKKEILIYKFKARKVLTQKKNFLIYCKNITLSIYLFNLATFQKYRRIEIILPALEKKIANSIANPNFDRAKIHNIPHNSSTELVQLRRKDNRVRSGNFILIGLRRNNPKSP